MGSSTSVQPFGNIMQVVEMNGAQIEQVLNEQYDQEERYFLQISGLSYTYVKTEDENQPFKVQDMHKKDGTAIKPDETYLVVINDFLFGGATVFQGLLVVSWSMPFNQTLRRLLDTSKRKKRLEN